MSGSMRLNFAREESFLAYAEQAMLGDGVTERVVWDVVKLYAAKSGFNGVAPQDLRRSCAKLCHSTGGELEQIQFLPRACICRNDGALSRLQAADSQRRQ